MLLAAVVFSLLCGTCAGVDFSVRCEDSAAAMEGASMVRAADGVPGRYRLRWCAAVRAAVTQWELRLDVDARSRGACLRNYSLFESLAAHPEKHSFMSVNMSEQLACNQMCFSVYLDLIFKGCYTVLNWLHLRDRETNSTYTMSVPPQMQHIDNSLTADYYRIKEPIVHVDPREDGVFVRWLFGYIPVGGFDMRLSDNSTWLDITPHCARAAWNEIRCLAPAGGAGGAAGAGGAGRALRPGPHRLQVALAAPWVHGDLFPKLADFYRDFEVVESRPPALAGARPARWLAAGAALAAAAAAGVGLLCWRRKNLRSWKMRVKRAWLQERECAAPAERAGTAGPGADVLLVYARDCEQLEEAMEALRALLQARCRGTVSSLFSAEAVAAGARGPDAWLRGALRDRRVVVLETRAAAALYTSDTPGGAPPLGSSVLKARAHPGDALVAAALARAQAAPAPGDYARYYVARISALPASLVPLVAPYRRYELPDALPLLLRDVTGAAAPLAPAPAAPTAPGAAPAAPAGPAPGPAADEAAFAAALRRYVEHVTRHPDYLRDELVFL